MSAWEVDTFEYDVAFDQLVELVEIKVPDYNDQILAHPVVSDVKPAF